MKRSQMSLCVFACLLVIPSVSSARVAGLEDGVGYVATQSVSSVIDDLRSAIDDVMHNAANEVGRGAFAVRGNGEILMRQLDVMMTELEGKTFKDLNDSQQAFFNNLNASLSELRATSKYTVEQANQLVQSADAVLGTLPGANRSARVINFSPRYVLSKDSDQTVNVSITGGWLGSGEPTLSAGTEKCERLSRTEAQLSFLCKLPVVEKLQKSAGEDVNEVSFRKLHLVTYDRTGFWGALFGRKPLPRSYDLAIAMVPSVLGTFSATADTSIPVIEYRDQAAERGSRNPHCKRSRDYQWQVDVAGMGEGWRIAQEPRIEKLGDKDASDVGLTQWTETGFLARGRAHNSGRCSWVSDDARGSVKIRAKWREQRTVNQPGKAEVEIGPIEWGDEKLVELPKGTKFVALTGQTIDGKTQVDTSTNSQGRSWYSVSFDVANGILLIKPRSLEDALNQN